MRGIRINGVEQGRGGREEEKKEDKDDIPLKKHPITNILTDQEALKEALQKVDKLNI